MGNVEHQKSSIPRKSIVAISSCSVDAPIESPVDGHARPADDNSDAGRRRRIDVQFDTTRSTQRVARRHRGAKGDDGEAFERFDDDRLEGRTEVAQLFPFANEAEDVDA